MGQAALRAKSAVNVRKSIGIYKISLEKKLMNEHSIASQRVSKIPVDMLKKAYSTFSKKAYKNRWLYASKAVFLPPPKF